MTCIELLSENLTQIICALIIISFIKWAPR